MEQTSNSFIQEDMSKGKRNKWPLISFCCQSYIEDRKKCTKQCDNCKEYYKPLEKKI